MATAQDDDAIQQFLDVNMEDGDDEVYERWEKALHREVYLVTYYDAIIGIALLACIEMLSVKYHILHYVVIERKTRKRGYGSALVKYMSSRLDLTVITKDESTVAWVSGMGFEKTSVDNTYRLKL